LGGKLLRNGLEVNSFLEASEILIDKCLVSAVAVNPAAMLNWLSAAREEPLFRQRPTDQFWFTYLPDSQTVYVSFRAYDW
jgi:hypothetical protein